MKNKIIISGFADEIAPQLSNQINVIRKLGISHIEMRGVDGLSLVLHPFDDVWKIKSVLDQNRIRLSAVGSPIGKIQITDPFEPHFELFKRTIAIAKILNTRLIRMFSFFIPENENAEKYQDEVFKRMDAFVNYAADQDVILLHENEKDIYGDIAPRCRALMDRFYGENFKAVFDFANFVQVGQDTLEAYELLKPFVYYIHVKDALKSDRQVVPAGYGDGNVETILRALFDSGFNGFLSLEPHLANFTGFSLLEQGDGHRKEPMSGEEAFTTAYFALKKILDQLGVTVPA
ncbi:xylose isomerase [Anaerolineaceae bacterium oral taxon 439]|nr:xylose isomerase [Anaerolineaceae bacterium oral taxon 439]